MAYKRKTVDRWDIESNWGNYWEIECSEYTKKEAYQTLKVYRENLGDRASFRLKKRRERIEEV